MENMDKGLTVSTKMGADNMAINKYPKCPKIYLPKLSAQAQKFGILMIKGLIVHSPWDSPLLPTASLLLFTLSFSSEPNVERPGERLGERLLLLPGLRLFLKIKK